MKIKSLFISKYKNIENVKLEFNSDLITLLVGQNGLGKSNLLEAISLIFRDLDLLEKEEDFEDWPFQGDNFSYDIQYECKELEVRIQCLDGMFRISSKPINTIYALEWVDFSHFKRNKNNFLPDYILGYYSGVNHRIKTFFSSHSQKRISNLKSKNPKPDFPALGKMFFTEQNHGELLYFALWVFKDSLAYGDKIKDLFENYLNIDLDSKVLIGFNNPLFAKNFPEKNADNLLSNLQDGVENPFWGLSGEINVLLNILWNNNSEHSIPIAFDDEEYDVSKDKYSFISFNNLDYSVLIKDLEGKFEDPIHFFDVLLAADQLGIIYAINGDIVKQGQLVSHNFKELSEGEQQLLTVLGLLLVTGKDDSLFLLDEPDTHLNPKWQRDLVKLVTKFNLNDSNSHIFIATHSPLVIQASEKADLLLYKLNQQGIVEIHNSQNLKIHNWRIDQVLASDFFEFKNTRPPKLDNFMEMRERLLSKPILTEIDIETLKTFQEAENLLPTGETLDDFLAIDLLRRIAKKENDKNQ